MVKVMVGFEPLHGEFSRRGTRTVFVVVFEQCLGGQKTSIARRSGRIWWWRWRQAISIIFLLRFFIGQGRGRRGTTRGLEEKTEISLCMIMVSMYTTAKGKGMNEWNTEAAACNKHSQHFFHYSHQAMMSLFGCTVHDMMSRAAESRHFSISMVQLVGRRRSLCFWDLKMEFKIFSRCRCRCRVTAGIHGFYFPASVGKSECPRPKEDTYVFSAMSLRCT